MKHLIICVLIVGSFINILAQERPFIYVTANERKAILEKIEHEEWAEELFIQYKTRTDKALKPFMQNPKAFFKNMPLNWSGSGTFPTMQTLSMNSGHGKKLIYDLSYYNQLGVDCGIMFYLTNDEIYAECAATILYTAIKGISQLPYPTVKRNAGWVQPQDHLFEARAIGAQLPIIYDFIAPYLKADGKPFDIAENKHVSFPFPLAQKVFLGYATLAIEQGMTGSNWSVLEAPSLVFNALALEDKQQRDSLLHIFLYQGSERQEAFVEIASHFEQEGDVYPETSQYSSGVAFYSTVLMGVLDKYNPSLNLVSTNKYIPLALSKWSTLKYPNGEIIRFGDGKRKSPTNYLSLECAYYVGHLAQQKEILEKTGNLLSTAVYENKYARSRLQHHDLGAHIYFSPLRLLWGMPNLQGEVLNRSLPRTDEMPHASVFLQRNLSASGRIENDLMCSVGGAHMVHGHAEGMNIELYGCGQVLGVDHGRGTYRTDLHENYSRLYAAHNTVIVNGNSCGQGGWVNLEINPVQLKAIEPAIGSEALSPYYSFVTTSFIDDKGDKAEAVQERTLALIRTSPTTGYYLDVFRSKSALPNEYHDYLYHNIGDCLTILNKKIKLHATPKRYQENASLPWVRNRSYRNPGWHFFKSVESSDEFCNDVAVRFEATKFEPSIFMDLHIIGFKDREYTKVDAPKTFEAPGAYKNASTPTLVIRKKGEAWNNPFVVVYEPYTNKNNSIVSVEKLMQNGKYKGVKVTSNANNRQMVQYIVTQDKSEMYVDDNLGLAFNGKFAILTTDKNGNTLSVYIGEGTSLTYKNVEITSPNALTAAYLNLEGDTPEFKSNNKNVKFTID